MEANLKRWPKSSGVTDNLHLEIKATLDRQAFPRCLRWKRQRREECRDEERQGCRDEGVSGSVMLFMRRGMSVEEGPVSRCKVPLQEIIHGGFRLKRSRFFCVLHITAAPPLWMCAIPRSPCILRIGSAGIRIWGFFCLLVRLNWMCCSKNKSCHAQSRVATWIRPYLQAISCYCKS